MPWECFDTGMTSITRADGQGNFTPAALQQEGTCRSERDQLSFNGIPGSLCTMDLRLKRSQGLGNAQVPFITRGTKSCRHVRRVESACKALPESQSFAMSEAGYLERHS